MSKALGPSTSSSVTEASDTGSIDSETQLEIVNSVRGMLNSGMSLNCNVRLKIRSINALFKFCIRHLFVIAFQRHVFG